MSLPDVAEGGNSRPVRPHFMDPLSAVLSGLSLYGAVPGIFEMRAPWGIEFGTPPSPESRQHMVSIGLTRPPGRRPKLMAGFFAMIRGSCWVDLGRERGVMALAGGDFVLINGPGPYVIQDDPKSPYKPFHQFLSRAHFEEGQNFFGGGEGPATTFIHGVFLSHDDAGNPLLSALPPVIEIRSDRAGPAERIQETVRALSYELSHRQPGGRGIIHHLAHILYINALRAHFADMPTSAGANWFRGLLDPDIRHALGLMHFHPDEPWTVASLAQRLSMSRSAFAARFMATVGTSPLQYLTESRMRRAKDLLRSNRGSMKEIAKAVGYANESAFSNAFRRQTGQSPGAFRKAQLNEETDEP